MKNKWTDKVQREDFDRMVRRGLTAVGAHLQGEAMVRCPVRTGRLRGSISWATEKEKMGNNVSTPVDKYTCHVGTNVEYSQHVEYGTRFMKAQPYLRPALDSNSKAVREIFKKYTQGMVRGQ